MRAVLGELVFSTADEPMEAVVGRRLLERGQTPGGGRVAHRWAGGVAARGGARSRARGSGAGSWPTPATVKFDLLDVPAGPVVSEAAAEAMADGVRRRLGADIGLVHHRGGRSRPSRRGRPPGTVWLGMAIGEEVDAVRVQLPGDRDRVRQMTRDLPPRPACAKQTG